MCIQRTWADALAIQAGEAVAYALIVTIEIVESNHGFALLTTVYPVKFRKEILTQTLKQIKTY